MVHLLKLCVGIDTVEQLEMRQAERLDQNRRAGRDEKIIHITRNTPRRAAELLNGGSLYWVIRRQILVRQVIVELNEISYHDGVHRCGLVLSQELVRTEPRSSRPFQGWRYLERNDAPTDLSEFDDGIGAMPEQMRRELNDLGLI